MTKPTDMALLLSDHGIEYRQAANNWINLACPVCYKGDGKFGLGWNGTGFHCFHCGTLDRLDVLKLLLNTSTTETLATLSRYQRGITAAPLHSDALQANLGGVSTVKLPYGTAAMTNRHKNYLQARQFDPGRLEAEWGLLGTGPVGPFAHRIIIPIISHLTNTICCFQGRDITDKAANKYKSCPDDKAVLPIKSCLYGLDKVQGNSVIVTEGPTKVWRLGTNSVCSFGATVTTAQMQLLQQFRRVFILFDEDDAGAEGADKLSRELVVLGTHCIIVSAGVRDVAELSDGDAKILMKDLLK